MSTAREFFDNQPQYMTLHYDTGVQADGIDYQITVKFCYDFEAGSKHLCFYIPDCPWPDAILSAILNNASEIWKAEENVQISSGIAGHSENVEGRTLAFTGRITVWTPASIEPERWGHLAKQLQNQRIVLIVRDAAYVERRSSFMAAPAFISHDSRDKEAFVRPLVDYLSRQLCPLWYDEYALKPGQGLRESIESGLKSCAKCVIVLSPHFFSNKGWSKREFDSIYTREIIGQERVMVPIWLNVVARDVYEYSPILADTVGIPAALGIEEVGRKIMQALDFNPPHPDPVSQ